MPLDNSVLKSFNLKNKAPDFASIDTTDFKQAIEYGIEQARANVKAITSNSEAPTFENTIEALEQSSDTLDDVASLFSSLQIINKDDTIKNVEKEIDELLDGYRSEVAYDEILFERVKVLYGQRDGLSLTQEQMMVLENSYKGFMRGGAELSDENKKRLQEVTERLSFLGTQYGNNVLDASNAFQHYIQDVKELDGLPEPYIKAAAERAKEEGREGEYLITLDAPVFLPILQYATNRGLREKIWFGFKQRASSGEYDNKPIVEEILSLRQEKAKILGFDNYASFILDERMAGDTGRVFSFLEDLKSVSIGEAKKDLEALKVVAAKDGITDFQPWDSAYYSEKYKEEALGFNSQELKQYYKLEDVLDGCFEHFSKLFSLKFEENKDYTTYDEDVRVFDVFDKDSGEFVSTLYADFFPRKNKKDGAWMDSYRDQGLHEGKVERPLIMIACNFEKPAAGNPSMLTQDDVVTLFHEMGHAMHGVLAQSTYRSVAGTSVKWDFVELPSQVQENWTYERETLDNYAKHKETGNKMPEELYQKLRKSSQFMTGSFRLRQVSLAMLDMKLHTMDSAQIKDIASTEKEIMEEFNLLSVHDTLVSTAFGHIFAGGYAAGYYSYQWAELLDADAFELFKEKGLYHKESADALKRLYSQGGSRDPNDLYKEFRGRDADPKAMLRRDGLEKPRV